MSDCCIQEVHNLGDDAPFLGYVQITEADHLAAMDAVDAELTMPDPVEGSDQ